MVVNVLLTTVLVTLFTVLVTAATIGLAALYMWIWRRLLSRMTWRLTDNRILYWPTTLAIVWPLLFALLLLLYQLFWFPLISEYLLLIIGVGLAAVWTGSAVVACRLMTQWAAARHWRMVLSTLILPLTFSLVLLSSPFLTPVLWRQTDNAAEYLRFFMSYHYYLAQVEKHPATNSGFIIWMPLYGDRGVLYDETDEITSDHPSEAWKKKAEREGVIRSGYRHIIGHFYYVWLDL
jgi:hypothetical protein